MLVSVKKALKRLLRPVVFGYRDYRDKKYYSQWLKNSAASVSQTDSSRLRYKPKISLVVPTYNTPEVFFHEMVGSVLAQTYDNWELVLVDDASPDATVRRLIKACAANDKRIKYKFLGKNRQIAGATNEAIKVASGEYIALFDHDDILDPNALLEVARALNKNRNLEFIYTDEDKITADGRKRYQPMLKPDWNPDFLRSVNYITHFTVIKKSVLDKFGYEDGGYNGTQDWELFLRITRNISAQRIHHIPKILYSWRVHDNSTAKALEAKPYVIEAQRKALEADIQERGLSGVAVKRDAIHPAQWRLEFDAPASATVSVVVGDPKLAVKIQSLQQRRAKKLAIEVAEINGQTTYKDLLEQITGDYAVFVCDKVTAHDLSWMWQMMGDASRDEIGFVLAQCTADVVMKNLADIVSGQAADFIGRMSRRMVIRHLYLTTRYNIRTIYGGVAMAEVVKLRHACDPDGRVSLLNASNALIGAGYHNLYNPYTRVLK